MADPAPPAEGLLPADPGDTAHRDQFVAARSKVASPGADSVIDSILAGSTPAPGAPAPAQAAPPGAPPAGGVPAPVSPAAGMKPPEQPIGARLWAGTKAVGKDIGEGVLGFPKHVIGGLLDATNNIMNFAADAVKYAESKGLPSIYVRFIDPTTGEIDPAIMSKAEGQAAAAKERAQGGTFTFKMGDADTVTGNIIRMGTAFLAGRKAVAGNPVSVAGNAGADLAAGAVALDPKEARLSNVVDAAVPNFLTDWLKAKPTDEGTMLGHLKTGLEMAGLGASITGVIAAVKALKTGLTAGAKGAGDSTPGASSAKAPAEDDFPEGGEPPAAPAAGSPGEPKETLREKAAKEVLDKGVDVTTELEKDQQPVGTGAAAGAARDILHEEQPLEAEFKAERAAEGKAKPLAPGEPPPGTEPTGMNKDYSDLVKAQGYPAAETGSPMAPPAPKMETVQVSPELKANFDRFMAQERGETPAPLEAVEGKKLADLRSADFSATGQNPVKVNLNMINGPADLKDAVARVSSQIPAEAVTHNDAVVAAAQSAGMSAEDFLAGPGGAMKNNEVVALRMIYQDTAHQFLQLAKAAAAPGAGDDAKAQALAAFAKFTDMTGFVQGAKAESGRSVQAWGIPIREAKIPYAEAVQRLAEVTGGPEGEQFLKKMAELETPEQVAAAAGAAHSMTGQEYFMYGWYNALLGPRTIIKKGISDFGMAMWNMATRYGAEKFGSAIPQGETAQLMQGYTGSFRDALAAARSAMAAGRSQFMENAQTLDAFDKTEALADQGAEISTETPTMGMREYLKAALPTTWIGAFDDFAKTLNYRAELRSLAYRTAATKGLTGEALESKTEALLSAPPMWLHRQAVQSALANTFQEPLSGIAASIKQVADGITLPLGHGGNFELPVGRILMPFVKVPVNITRFAYSNSPLPLAFPSSRIAAELAAGGATRDLAISKMALGTAVTTSMLGLTLAGVVTGHGPSDPQLRAAWRSAGNEPNSIKMPDGKQYGYNMLEPWGMQASIIADTIDVMRFAKEEDAGQAAASLVFGTGEAMMSKTYLSGVADFFNALHNPDSESTRWFDRIIGTAVPNTVADFRRAQDPWLRAHRDLLSGIENRLPYISEGLPPQRTLWGDPIHASEGFVPFMTGTGAARMLSPVAVGPANDAQPIDKWIWEHRLDFPRGQDNKLGLSKPSVIQSFAGGPRVSTTIELTPAMHDRLQVLAGNELKDPSTGLGARDTLNALVEGNYPNGSFQREWDNAPPPMQAIMVQTVVNRFRAMAKQQLPRDFPELEDALRAGWNARKEALTQ